MTDTTMSAIELRCCIEALGIPQVALGDLFGVKDRTARRWIAGTSPVPVGVAGSVRALGVATHRVTSNVSGGASVSSQDAADAWAYVVDEAGLPESAQMPASWWRAILGHRFLRDGGSIVP